MVRKLLFGTLDDPAPGNGRLDEITGVKTVGIQHVGDVLKMEKM